MLVVRWALWWFAGTFALATSPDATEPATDVLREPATCTVEGLKPGSRRYEVKGRRTSSRDKAMQLAMQRLCERMGLAEHCESSGAFVIVEALGIVSHACGESSSVSYQTRLVARRIVRRSQLTARSDRGRAAACERAEKLMCRRLFGSSGCPPGYDWVQPMEP